MLSRMKYLQLLCCYEETKKIFGIDSSVGETCTLLL